MTRTLTYYVKSLDGSRWYVGDERADRSRGHCSALGRYVYAAQEWGSENEAHARGYGRALEAMGHTVVFQGVAA